MDTEESPPTSEPVFGTGGAVVKQVSATPSLRPDDCDQLRRSPDTESSEASSFEMIDCDMIRQDKNREDAEVKQEEMPAVDSAESKEIVTPKKAADSLEQLRLQEPFVKPPEPPSWVDVAKKHPPGYDLRPRPERPFAQQQPSKKKQPEMLNIRERDKDDVVVRFETLVAPEWNLRPEDKVYIAAGKPVSDFDEFICQLTPERRTPNGYLFAAGEISVSRLHLGKPIPYKYVIVQGDGSGEKLMWEHIFFHDFRWVFNRILDIPLSHRGAHFLKIDDVIWKTKDCACTCGREGRIEAGLEMLPDVEVLIRNERVDLKNFSDRAQAVANALTCNGTKIVSSYTGNIFDLNPVNFQLQDIVRPYRNKLIKLAEEHDNYQVRFRAALCLAVLRKKDIQNTNDMQAIVRGFAAGCSAWKTDPGILGRIRFGVKDEVKAFDFHAVKVVKEWLQQSYLRKSSEGHYWLFMMPFIHAWGRSDDSWLDADRCGYLDTIESYSSKLGDFEHLFDLDPLFGATYLKLTTFEEDVKIIRTNTNVAKKLHFDVLLMKIAKMHSEVKGVFGLRPRIAEMARPTIESCDENQWYNFLNDCLKCGCARPFSDPMKIKLELILMLAELAGLHSSSNHDLRQSFALELREACLKQLRRRPQDLSMWPECLSKIKQVDAVAHLEMVEKDFREVIMRLEPDNCLGAFLDLEDLDEEAMDVMMERINEIFDQKKDGNFVSRLWNSVKETFGFSENKLKRLTRLIESCVTANMNGIDAGNPEEAINKLTDKANLSNLLAIVPHLKQGEHLSKDIVKQIKGILKIVNDFNNLLIKGEITIKSMKTMNMSAAEIDPTGKCQRLLKLTASANEMLGEKQKDLVSVGNLEKILKARQQELQFVKKQRTTADDFFKKMRRFVVELPEECKSFSEDISNKALSEFCKPRNGLEDKIILKLNIHSGDSGDIGTMDKFNLYFNQSNIFRKFQEEVLKTSSLLKEEDGCTVEDMLHEATEVIGKFHAYCDKLFSSQIAVKDVEADFKRGDTKKDLKDAANAIKDYKSYVDKVDIVNEQIQALFLMQNCERSAAAVIEVAQILKIEDKIDLGPLNNIMRLRGGEDTDLPLVDAINDNVIKAGRRFQYWTDEGIEALTTLVKVRRLVEWVTKEIHSVQELKVFVELANISAGESGKNN